MYHEEKSIGKRGSQGGSGEEFSKGVVSGEEQPRPYTQGTVQHDTAQMSHSRGGDRASSAYRVEQGWRVAFWGS